MSVRVEPILAVFPLFLVPFHQICRFFSKIWKNSKHIRHISSNISISFIFMDPIFSCSFGPNKKLFKRGWNEFWLESLSPTQFSDWKPNNFAILSYIVFDLQFKGYRDFQKITMAKYIENGRICKKPGFTSVLNNMNIRKTITIL